MVIIRHEKERRATNGTLCGASLGNLSQKNEGKKQSPADVPKGPVALFLAGICISGLFASHIAGIVFSVLAQPCLYYMYTYCIYIIY